MWKQIFRRWMQTVAIEDKLFTISLDVRGIPVRWEAWEILLAEDDSFGNRWQKMKISGFVEKLMLGRNTPLICLQRNSFKKEDK